MRSILGVAVLPDSRALLGRKPQQIVEKTIDRKSGRYSASKGQLMKTERDRASVENAGEPVAPLEETSTPMSLPPFVFVGQILNYRAEQSEALPAGLLAALTNGRHITAVWVSWVK